MATILNFHPRRFCRLIGWRLARQRHWALQAFLVITVILLIPTLFTSWAFIKNLEQNSGMIDAAAAHAGRDMAISFAVKIIGLCCLAVYPSLYIRDMEENLEYFDTYGWDVSPREIEWYRAHAENLSLAKVNWLYSDDSGEAWELMNQYREGQISGPDMLAAIDKKVQMMLLEGN